MAKNLAIDPHDPDLTAGDVRDLARQLDAHGVPNETPVGMRKTHLGERLVVELKKMRRTILPKKAAPTRKRGPVKPRTGRPAAASKG